MKILTAKQWHKLQVGMEELRVSAAQAEKAKEHWQQKWSDEVDEIAIRRQRREDEIRRFIEKCGPLDAEKMLRAFAVPETNELLLGVTALLIGMERIAKSNLLPPHMEQDARDYYAGALWCATEAQNWLAKLVQKGNQAVGQTKK